MAPKKKEVSALAKVLMAAREQKDATKSLMENPTPFYFDANREIIITNRQFIDKKQIKEDNAVSSPNFSDSDDEKPIVWGETASTRRMEELF